MEDNTIKVPWCTGCNKSPADINEYVEGAAELGITPDEYVRKEEGTYNRENGHFRCTDCYIRAGMPSLPSPQQWVAP